ncbi:unnamed protein product, partial [Ectocarpus sp. 12 AP-2014]
SRACARGKESRLRFGSGTEAGAKPIKFGRAVLLDPAIGALQLYNVERHTPRGNQKTKETSKAAFSTERLLYCCACWLFLCGCFVSSCRKNCRLLKAHFRLPRKST